MDANDYMSSFITFIEPAKETPRSYRNEDGDIIRVEAQTEKTGFLHLSPELRDIIYRLAIYDHDRGAVFLPRALPRKVCEDQDVDLPGDPLYGADSVGEAWAEFGEQFPATQNEAAGTWRGFEEVEAEETAQVIASEVRFQEALRELEARPTVDEMTEQNGDGDGNGEERVANATADGHGGDAVIIHEDAGAQEEAEASSEDNDSFLADVDALAVCGDGTTKCHCYCHTYDNYYSDDDDGRAALKEDLDGPPQACLDNECDNDECEYCAGFGLGPDQDESEWENSSNSPEPEDKEDEDFDLDENMGVLYHPREPGILLVCQQIRDECLPVYYRKNSFSWRFQLSDYQTSLGHFEDWAKYTVGPAADLMKHISLEGRSCQEYGVDFCADIDVDKDRPFELQLSADRNEPGSKAIKEILEKELAYPLWKTSDRGRSGTKLSAQSLVALGRAFVRAMHTEPSEAMRQLK